jgi:hypothetical protein
MNFGMEHSRLQPPPAFRVAGTRLYTPVAGEFSLFNASGQAFLSLQLPARGSVDLAELAQGSVIVRCGSRSLTVALP